MVQLESPIGGNRKYPHCWL